MDKRAKIPATSRSEKDSRWSRLWDSSIPPKVKMFGWKAIHNGLSVMENMAKRGLGVDVICPKCRSVEETILHMLLKCEDARRVWYLSPLRVDVENVLCRKFGEWVEDLAKCNLEDDWWNLFWMVCWHIWLARNRWVFDKQRLDCRDVVEKEVRGSLEFVAANASIEIIPSVCTPSSC